MKRLHLPAGIGKLKFPGTKYWIIFLGTTLLLSGAILLVLGFPGKINSGDVAPSYNRGVDAYTENVNTALQQFERASQEGSNKHLQALSLYNLGTVLGEQSFDERLSLKDRLNIVQLAIGKLRAAVALDPDNEEAKWNYEFLMFQREGIVQAMIAQGLLPSDAGKKPQEQDPDDSSGYAPASDESRGF